MDRPLSRRRTNIRRKLQNPNQTKNRMSTRKLTTTILRKLRKH